MIGEFLNGIYKIILCKGNLLSEEIRGNVYNFD